MPDVVGSAILSSVGATVLASNIVAAPAVGVMASDRRERSPARPKDAGTKAKTESRPDVRP